MGKILTIIIPTYNMEKYLSACLDSLIVPSLDEVEVLVINDGSTDSSLEIASEYSRRYPNVFRVVDKSNGNYGSCINRGLSESTGKYIKILDADDCFDGENFELFISFLKSQDADMVVSSYAITDECRAIKSIKNAPVNISCASFESMVSVLTDWNLAMHAVAYNAKIFHNLNYHQTEGISFTDIEWIFAPLSRIHTISFFPQVVYKYMLGRDGQTMGFKNPVKSAKDMFQMLDGIVKVYVGMIGELDAAHKKYYELFLKKNLPYYYKIFTVIYRNKEIDDIIKKFDENLKTSIPEIYLYMNTLTARKYFPFHYIDYWRKRILNNKEPVILKIIHFVKY